MSGQDRLVYEVVGIKIFLSWYSYITIGYLLEKIIRSDQIKYASHRNHRYIKIYYWLAA